MEYAAAIIACLYRLAVLRGEYHALGARCAVSIAMMAIYLRRVYADLCILLIVVRCSLVPKRFLQRRLTNITLID